MRLHRFYTDPSNIELDHDFWLKDEDLRNQWAKVLRYKPGDEVVLFDGVQHERLYKIEEIADDAVHLNLITDFERKIPDSHVYLFFSLLKKDKNDWIIQKCTELGVKNFVPILASRSEKTGFNLERAKKIIIEAAEQCGRSDIPHVREPLLLETALSEYGDKVKLLAADEENPNTKHQASDIKKPVGVFIGPEGGWTDDERLLFDKNKVGHLHLGKLTLRAETAAVVATGKIL